MGPNLDFSFRSQTLIAGYVPNKTRRLGYRGRAVYHESFVASRRCISQVNSCLDVADRKSAYKSVVFAFEPVFVDGAQQVYDVTFTQRQFSAAAHVHDIHDINRHSNALTVVRLRVESITNVTNTEIKTLNVKNALLRK